MTPCVISVLCTFKKLLRTFQETRLLQTVCFRPYDLLWDPRHLLRHPNTHPSINLSNGAALLWSLWESLLAQAANELQLHGGRLCLQQNLWLVLISIYVESFSCFQHATGCRRSHKLTNLSLGNSSHASTHYFPYKQLNLVTVALKRSHIKLKNLEAEREGENRGK